MPKPKFLKSVTNFFKYPTLHEGIPVLKEPFTIWDDKTVEGTRRDNEISIAKASLALSREALQNNLDIVHRSFIISLLAVFVAITAVLVAILKS